MPGGSLHSPIWKPYALYGTIDYIYGFPAWDAKNGFTAAQAALNVVETVGYTVYLWIMWTKGRRESVTGRGAPSKNTVGMLGEARVVRGTMAAWAVLIGFGTSLMTVSKTVLYCEYFSTNLLFGCDALMMVQGPMNISPVLRISGTTIRSG